LAALWLAGLIVGSMLLLRYEQTPGPSVAAAASRADLPIALSQSGPTVVMFAHPHCPCTRASLAELAKVLARNPGANAHLFFFAPEHVADPAWNSPGLRPAAAEIPGLTIHDDPQGALCSRLGITTSGTVLVLSRDGEVLFRGGVTSGRGHQGDNAGSDAVQHLLRGEAGVASTPTYGCSITNPDDESCPRCAAESP
jgi:hypothetical protein